MWELGSDADEPEWSTVESPFKKSLYGVVSTVEGPYAAGAGGTVIANRGDGWEIVFDDGPRTRDNQLRALTVTNDGERIWFAGSSGAVGCYDVVTRRKYDYSSPEEMTSTWEGIAVSGKTGSEKGLLANGSGELLPFGIDGFDVDWGEVAKPQKKGSKISALDASPDGVGYAVDTSGNAFKTTPEDGWEDIGIVNAQVKFYDIHAGTDGRVYVAAGDGRIYRYDDSYRSWTPIGVGKNALRAFDIYQGEMVVLGNGGEIYQRDRKERWEKVPAPKATDLIDLALGKPDVAVGKGGLIIERPRGRTRDSGTSPDQDQYDDRGEHYDADSNAPGDSTTSDSTTSDSTTSDSTTSDSTTSDSTTSDSTTSDSTTSDSTTSDSTTTSSGS
jgi:hypothetical protein